MQHHAVELNRRRGRHAQCRGQVLPITMVFATLLLGAVALAVDLSLQTHQRRSAQNVTDAAALAGATDLGATQSQAQRRTAVTDSLRIVHDRIGMSGSGTTWATGLLSAQSGTNCSDDPSGTYCDISTAVVAGGGTYSVFVAVPPSSAANSAYNGRWGYAQVDVSETTANGFGGVIGRPTGTVRGHSIAYHFPPGQSYGFALFSNTTIGTGNQNEVVNGNAYAYRSIQPQGSGAFCAAPDPSGTPGAVVLGYPQSGPVPSPDPAGGAPYQSAVTTIQYAASCTGANKGVFETARLSNNADCSSLSVQGVNLSTVYDAGAGTCVANPPLGIPDLQAPTLTGATVIASPAVLDSTWVSTHGPGVYDVMHSCSGCTDVTIDGSSPANCPAQYSGSYTTCLLGYTFYLENGATMDVTGKTSVLITPYVPAATQNPNDGFFAVYAPPGSSASLTEEKNGTLLAMTGTVYMPSGTVNIVTNAILRIDGQALVNTWNVQSGNHDNPVITFNNQRAATQREVLQLVE